MVQLLSWRVTLFISASVHPVRFCRSPSVRPSRPFVSSFVLAFNKRIMALRVSNANRFERNPRYTLKETSSKFSTRLAIVSCCVASLHSAIHTVNIFTNLLITN